MEYKSEYKVKRFEDLFFTDDFLFSKIMRDPEIARGVVESLLGFKVKKIEFLTSQHSIAALFGGRGVRLDAYLEDSDRVVNPLASFACQNWKQNLKWQCYER